MLETKLRSFFSRCVLILDRVSLCSIILNKLARSCFITGVLFDLAKDHQKRVAGILDPLGLFHKKEPQSSSSSHSYGSNLQLGPLSFSSSLASSSATAEGNGATSVAKANSQAFGQGSAKADASAVANAQGIRHSEILYYRYDYYYNILLDDPLENIS